MNTAMLHSQTITLGFCALGCSAIAATAAAQDDQRLVMPLSDASRPATLEIAVFMGDVHVRGYDGDEVIIVADAPMRDADEEEAPRADGLRRIQTSSVGLTVEEANNVVTVRMEYSPRDIDIDVQVPNRTSVRANLVNGDVTVMGVTGEHELTNVNGDVTATDLSGSAVINSTNGDIEATLVAVDAARPMSFTSFNGDITVALPANLAADLLVTSQQGEVFTDFEVEELQEPAVIERNNPAGGRYRVRMKRETRYAIGGGGPDIQLRNFNGDIVIRKR